MSNFLQALFNPNMPFIRNALIAGLLSSVLFGVLGTIVTVKRIASLAGAISHAVLGGIGLALYFNATGILPFMPPIAGAIIFAVIAALIIAMVSLKAKGRNDTVINAIWAIGMSIGVVSMAKTPGYTDPLGYLFGNILLISNTDLILLAVLDVIVMILVWRFYPQLEATSFDDEFSQVRGINTQTLFVILLIITAIAIVLLQTFVGIVMVIAMLTLPAGTAGFHARNMAMMMIFSTIYSSIFSMAGLVTGWYLDMSVGAMVVLVSGAVFLAFSVVRMIRKPAGGKG
ncbi:MAG: metal ABC transporter permease [Sphaerochaetaceae bacterium]|nr:metal ABC transporter permease [Sphaerochaetaceae bacterium]